jgi:hypothetical protein
MLGNDLRLVREFNSRLNLRKTHACGMQSPQDVAGDFDASAKEPFQRKYQLFSNFYAKSCGELLKGIYNLHIA